MDNLPPLNQPKWADTEEGVAALYSTPTSAKDIFIADLKNIAHVMYEELKELEGFLIDLEKERSAIAKEKPLNKESLFSQSWKRASSKGLRAYGSFFHHLDLEELIYSDDSQIKLLTKKEIMEITESGFLIELVDDLLYLQNWLFKVHLDYLCADYELISRLREDLVSDLSDLKNCFKAT